MLTSVLVLISHSSTTTTTQSSWFPECSATISIESEEARHIDHLDRYVQQSCQPIYPKRSSLRDVWLTSLIVDQLMKNDGFPTFSQQIWMFSEIRNDNQMRNKQFPYDDTQNSSEFLQGNCDYGMPLEMIPKKLLSALSVDNYKIDRSAS